MANYNDAQETFVTRSLNSNGLFISTIITTIRIVFIPALKYYSSPYISPTINKRFAIDFKWLK